MHSLPILMLIAYPKVIRSEEKGRLQPVMFDVALLKAPATPKIQTEVAFKLFGRRAVQLGTRQRTVLKQGKRTQKTRTYHARLLIRLFTLTAKIQRSSQFPMKTISTHASRSHTCDTQLQLYNDRWSTVKTSPPLARRTFCMCAQIELQEGRHFGLHHLSCKQPLRYEHGHDVYCN